MYQAEQAPKIGRAY